MICLLSLMHLLLSLEALHLSPLLLLASLLCSFMTIVIPAPVVSGDLASVLDGSASVLEFFTLSLMFWLLSFVFLWPLHLSFMFWLVSFVVLWPL